MSSQDLNLLSSGCDLYPHSVILRDLISEEGDPSSVILLDDELFLKFALTQQSSISAGLISKQISSLKCNLLYKLQIPIPFQISSRNTTAFEIQYSTSSESNLESEISLRQVNSKDILCFLHTIESNFISSFQQTGEENKIFFSFTTSVEMKLDSKVKTSYQDYTLSSRIVSSVVSTLSSRMKIGDQNSIYCVYTAYEKYSCSSFLKTSNDYHCNSTIFSSVSVQITSSISFRERNLLNINLIQTLPFFLFSKFKTSEDNRIQTYLFSASESKILSRISSRLHHFISSSIENGRPWYTISSNFPSKISTIDMNGKGLYWQTISSEVSYRSRGLLDTRLKTSSFSELRSGLPKNFYYLSAKTNGLYFSHLESSISNKLKNYISSVCKGIVYYTTHSEISFIQRQSIDFKIPGVRLNYLLPSSKVILNDHIKDPLVILLKTSSSNSLSSFTSSRQLSFMVVKYAALKIRYSLDGFLKVSNQETIFASITTFESYEITCKFSPLYSLIKMKGKEHYLSPMISSQLARQKFILQSKIKSISAETIRSSFARPKNFINCIYRNKISYSISVKLATNQHIIFFKMTTLYYATISCSFPKSKNIIHASTYHTLYYNKLTAGLARQKFILKARSVKVDESNIIHTQISSRGWGSFKSGVGIVINAHPISSVINILRRNSKFSSGIKGIERNEIRASFPFRGGRFSSYIHGVERNEIKSAFPHYRSFISAKIHGYERTDLLSKLAPANRCVIFSKYTTTPRYRIAANYSFQPYFSIKSSYISKLNFSVSSSISMNTSFTISGVSIGKECHIIKASCNVKVFQSIDSKFFGTTIRIFTARMVLLRKERNEIFSILYSTASFKDIKMKGLCLINYKLSSNYICNIPVRHSDQFVCRIICYKQFDNTYPDSQVVELAYTTFEIQEED